MITLFLSTDQKILDTESAVRARMISYGALFECLHIVLISKGRSRAEILAQTVSVTTTGGLVRPFSLVRAGIILCQTIARLKKEKQKMVLSSQDAFEQGLVCFFVSKITGIPFHLQVHTDIFSSHFASESFLQNVRVKIARFLLPRADGARVVSERIKKSFVEQNIFLKREAVVLPIFVDTEKIRAYAPKIDLHKKYSQFEKIMLMMSRLEPEKEILVGIKAFQKLREKNPRIGLVIVGSGSQKEILKSFVRDAGLEECILFEGWTNDSLSYMKTCDVLLNTSRYEGYGLTLVEALVSGKEVVTTDVGVASEFRDSLHIFPVGDSTGATEKLQTALSSPKNTSPIILRTQTEYNELYKKSLEEVCVPRLLILTQIVDKNDTLLGFFHGWVAEFAKVFPRIVAVCLKKGEVSLPENVSVFSLGKEVGRGRLGYVFRFYFLVWKHRKEYDAVFVHMNQEYILLAGILWWLLGKKIYMWRNHTAGNFLTSTACFLCNKTFCPSQFSYINRFKKNVLMPVGIDTNFFRPNHGTTRKENSILSLGRISRIKNIDVLIDALSETKDPWTLTVVGDALPKDASYCESLKTKVREKKLESRISFVPGIPNKDTPRIYSEHEIFVNLSPSGLFDKTIFEAMLCGALTVTNNKNMVGKIDPLFIPEEGSVESFRNSLQRILSLTKQQKDSFQYQQVGYAKNEQSLQLLTEKLASELY